MSLSFKFLIGPEVVEAEQQLPVEQRVQWPLDSIVMFAMDGEEVIGRMGLMSVKLVEGTWAAPDAPPTTAYRMMKQMEGLVTYLGNTSLNAMTHDSQPQIADYLKRVGFVAEPFTLYTKDLTKQEMVA